MNRSLGNGISNDKNSRGIVLTIIAMLCLAGMDATGKLLVQTYPIGEIMAIRFTIFFIVAFSLTPLADVHAIA